jgi:hypothetical protein
MTLGPDSDEARRFRLTLDMHEFGVAIYRQTLRRKHPEESEAEIAVRLREWLRNRPAPTLGPAALSAPLER